MIFFKRFAKTFERTTKLFVQFMKFVKWFAKTFEQLMKFFERFAKKFEPFMKSKERFVKTFKRFMIMICDRNDFSRELSAVHGYLCLEYLQYVQQEFLFTSTRSLLAADCVLHENHYTLTYYSNDFLILFVTF